MTNWGKGCVARITDKGLISLISKRLLQIKKKDQWPHRNMNRGYEHKIYGKENINGL